MARCACEPAGGATTRLRTPPSCNVGSTSARCTRSCAARACGSKKRWRSSTSSPEGKPSSGDTCFSSFESWRFFWPTTCVSLGATWPLLGPSRLRGEMAARVMALMAGQVGRASWT